LSVTIAAIAFLPGSAPAAEPPLAATPVNTAAPSLTGTPIAVSLMSSRADAKVSSVRRSDVLATRLYVRAMQKLSQIARREAPKSEADIHGLIARVNSQCPNILAGAPDTKVVDDLRFQTLEQISKAGGEPTRAADIKFAKTADRLHWSDRKLDYYVHGSAEEEQANAELKTPDICEEARGIVASAYKTAPPIMVRFENEVRAANNKVTIDFPPPNPSKEGSGDLHERIMALLRPYMLPSEKKLLPPKPTTEQTEQALKVFFGYAEELVKALGLSVGTQ
jgi:hypothetical protein